MHQQPAWCKVSSRLLLNYLRGNIPDLPLPGATRPMFPAKNSVMSQTMTVDHWRELNTTNMHPQNMPIMATRCKNHLLIWSDFFVPSYSRSAIFLEVCIADCAFAVLHSRVQLLGWKMSGRLPLWASLSWLIVSAWKWQDPILNGCAISHNRHIVLYFFAPTLAGACAPPLGGGTIPTLLQYGLYT